LRGSRLRATLGGGPEEWKLTPHGWRARISRCGTCSLILVIFHVRYYRVEVELVNQGLKRAHVCVTNRSYKQVGLISADFQPLLFVKLQLFGQKLSATRMLVVVAVNLCVAFEAHRNRVFDTIAAIVLYRNNVVCLDLDATEAMTDAAASVRLREKYRDFVW